MALLSTSLDKIKGDWTVVSADTTLTAAQAGGKIAVTLGSVDTIKNRSVGSTGKGTLTTPAAGVRTITLPTLASMGTGVGYTIAAANIHPDVKMELRIDPNGADRILWSAKSTASSNTKWGDANGRDGKYIVLRAAKYGSGVKLVSKGATAWVIETGDQFEDWDAQT